MPSRELSEWIAFANVEPIGEAREDFRNALLMSVIANTFRNENSKTISPVTFLIDWWEELKPQSWQEQKSIMAGVAALQRGIHDNRHTANRKTNR
jgi:hypothetical protein